MNYNQKHAQALTRFHRGQPREAARLFAEALAEKETGDCWNDWATAQLACGAMAEAEAGYGRALELEPEHRDALVNLGVVYINGGRLAEALPLLRRSLPRVAEEHRGPLQHLIRECQEQTGPEDDPEWLEVYLRRFAGTSEDARNYFETHLARYVATLQLLPAATPGQRLLELGAAFPHLTPALARVKGYEVVCSETWSGVARLDRCVCDVAGTERHMFPVHNFDLESESWPFEDASFDVIVGCDVLEHLARDPMLVLQQINRALKPDGLLLLTTPNIASAKSVAYVLRGDSPYVFGQYIPGGSALDRHNREYTPTELERIIRSAGFQTVRLQTQNSWWRDQGSVLRHLLGLGMPVTRRGDDILLLARKHSNVQERFPEELYCNDGSQAARRPAASASLDSSMAPSHPERILVVHEVLPHFDRSGTDLRLQEVLRTLRYLGHPVTYVARNGVNQDRYESGLRAMGIEVYTGDSMALRALGVDAPVSDWRFADVLQEGQFDVAILFHGYGSGISVTEHYLDEIRRESPATKVVVLTDDRHGERELRLAETTGQLCDEERAVDFQQRELESYRLADLVLTISENDRHALHQLDATLAIELLPMAAGLAPPGPGWEERRDVLFLADFDSPINRDALHWLCGEIWPRVRRALPGVKLHLACAHTPPLPSARAEDIVCLNHIPELAETLSGYRVFLSPSRFPKGIQAQNVMAMAHGLPVVSTAAGAEGMALTDGVNALMADTAVKFAAAVVQVYNDGRLWQSLASKGRGHIEQEFSPERAQEGIKHALQILRTTRAASEDKNHRWSIRIVEELQPQILSEAEYKAAQSLELRILTYADYAERLLTAGRPAEARDQLRHIFSFLRGTLPEHPFFARVWMALEQCYRELGEPERSRRCGQEALRFIPEFNPRLAQVGSGGRRTPASVPARGA